MRILTISHNYPHQEDPTCGIFVARQLKEMARQGADIVHIVPIVYAPKSLKQFERYKEYGPTRRLIVEGTIEAHVQPYLRLPGRYFLPFDGKLSYLSMKRKISVLHEKVPFDVVFGRGLWMEADVAIRIGRLLRIPSVGMAIGSDVNVTPLYGKRYNRHFVDVTSKLDCLLATGQGVADQISQVNGKKIPVIFGLVDLDEFKPTIQKRQLKKQLGLGKDLIVLFVGHLNKSKGVYELVDAFSEISTETPNARLVICGNGREYSNLEKWVAHKARPNSTLLMGTVAPDQISRIMQACDMLTLPSYNEGMPNVVMEAMACGLPVIATSVGGLPAAIGNSKGAILIAPRDTSALKKNMEVLLKNQELRSQMGIAARSTAEKKFCIKNNVGRLLKVMKKAKDNFALT